MNFSMLLILNTLFCRFSAFEGKHRIWCPLVPTAHLCLVPFESQDDSLKHTKKSAWGFLGYFQKYRLFAKLLAKTVLFGAHAQIWAYIF